MEIRQVTLGFFRKQNLPDATLKWMDNLHLHVFDMRFLPKKIGQNFKSDMRIVVDYLAEGSDYKPTNQPILHVDAFLQMMKALTDDFRYEEIMMEWNQQPIQKGAITMCKLLDKYEAKGEERVNKLISLLLKQSRLEDIEKAVNNREYQQKLFEQYGI